MSRFQKIFLASALVVVGFGVAKFLGQPVLPTQLISSRSILPTPPAVVQTAPASMGVSQSAGRVRLLPDSPMMHAGAPATKAESAISQAPRLGNALGSVLAASEMSDSSKIPRSFDFAPISSAPVGEIDLPRARLRNEAPRPVSVGPQSPGASLRVPIEDAHATDPYNVADTKMPPPVWSAPQLLNAGYSEFVPPPPTALPASYAAPVSGATESQVGPPPWPMHEETTEPRVHIVVDGDSLERLASRYLLDPQRSREIYELNREILSAPDLLPIGAELKIPDRVASAALGRRGFQPNSTDAILRSEISHDKMMTARPASAPQSIIPRAQLAAPVMVQ